jgi:hypothetical protein
VRKYEIPFGTRKSTVSQKYFSPREEFLSRTFSELSFITSHNFLGESCPKNTHLKGKNFGRRVYSSSSEAQRWKNAVRVHHINFLAEEASGLTGWSWLRTGERAVVQKRWWRVQLDQTLDQVDIRYLEVFLTPSSRNECFMTASLHTKRTIKLWLSETYFTSFVLISIEEPKNSTG